MSTNLLNTPTPNWIELIGNGKHYVVPPYQRDYSWGEEQWEDLWRDITDLVDNPETSHYMGTLVLEANSDREFLIIDGQQRFATLSILTLAVIERLNYLGSIGIEPEANRERAKELKNQYIGKKNPASLIESTRLKLNLHDDPFYQDYLVAFRVPAIQEA